MVVNPNSSAGSGVQLNSPLKSRKAGAQGSDLNSSADGSDVLEVSRTRGADDDTMAAALEILNLDEANAAAEYVRREILGNSTTSLLVQGNARPERVLELLADY